MTYSCQLQVVTTTLRLRHPSPTAMLPLISLLIEVDLHCAENASIIYRNYMLAICLIGFFGPLIIIIFCYARILGIMYSSEKKMRKGFRTFGDRNVAEVACSG